MVYPAEKRRYQRCTNTVCKVLMSTDKARWLDTELCDISAGGLRFASQNSYEVDDRIFFNIYVYNMATEFNMRFEGDILRKEQSAGKSFYAVKFINAEKRFQVQLDEIIRSKTAVGKSIQSVCGDGVYSFALSPRVRSAKTRRII